MESLTRFKTFLAVGAVEGSCPGQQPPPATRLLEGSAAAWREPHRSSPQLRLSVRQRNRAVGEHRWGSHQLRHLAQRKGHLGGTPLELPHNSVSLSNRETELRGAPVRLSCRSDLHQ
ncbi:hypothetical protein CRG98_001663 [Punica granatum]|uniref:Uncharacterized protein n=1 Tax=Punica granatum TaxID=22663 RepID=A0A2I0LBH6_PUNGR|nr:hypothetical protein CRG98_001663 [Punica granatum]